MRVSLPIQKNITIAIGADYALNVRFSEDSEDIDLSDWNFWAEIWHNGSKLDDFDIDVVGTDLTISLPHSRTINYLPVKDADWSLRFETDTLFRCDLFVGKASIVLNPTIPTPTP